MAITLSVAETITDMSGSAQAITGTVNYSGSSVIRIHKVIPASTTDSLIDAVFPHASVVLGVLVASGPCTLETNDGGSPVDTVAFLAGTPKTWVGDASDDVFAHDVTAFYVTTPSGSAVTFQGLILLP